ncbi:MAG: dihydrofolate reductase family protein [Pelobium sp.]
MRKLILEIQMSIDGFIARPNGDTNWMIWNWGLDWKWDKKLQDFHTNLNKSIDCILLSKQMAEEGFKMHWQQVADDVNDSRYEFAKHITKAHKIVFSTTLKKSTPIPGGWENTEIAEGNFVEYINQLKRQVGKDIIVYGGATFVASLIKAGLIDEFYLIVNPTAIGNGLPIFNSLEERQDMKLMNAQPYECVVLVLNYTL